MVSLRMARRFVRGGAARLALTVLAVAWGVALVGAVRLANQAVLRAFVEVVETMAGRAERARVARGGVGGGGARGRGGGGRLPVRGDRGPRGERARRRRGGALGAGDRLRRG